MNERIRVFVMLGVRADFEHLGQRLEALFDVQLKLDDEADFGGVYWDFIPASPTINRPRIKAHPNRVNLEGAEWTAERHQDSPFIVRLTFETVNLLELGELSARLRSELGSDTRVIAELVSAPVATPWTWDRYVEFDRSGPILLDGQPITPASAQLVWGLPEIELPAALAIAQAAFPVTFTEASARQLGQYLVANAPSPDVRSLVIRRNNPRLATWLYPTHRDWPWLMVATMEARSLTSLGELTYRVKATCDANARIIEYVVQGDLAGDGMLRELRADPSRLA